YNDRRTETHETRPSDPADRDALAEACTRSSFRWTDQGTDDPASDIMFLHVDDAPGALMLTVLGYAGYFSAAQMEALVRGMEAVAVAAASAEVAQPAEAV